MTFQHDNRTVDGRRDCAEIGRRDTVAKALVLPCQVPRYHLSSTVLYRVGFLLKSCLPGIILAHSSRILPASDKFPSMPPKKKVRQPSRAASTPAGDAVVQAEEETRTPMKADLGAETVKSDAWTDEQETSLFKSMIRWKPVGSFFDVH